MGLFALVLSPLSVEANDTRPSLTYDVSGSDAWAPYFMVTKEGLEYGIMPELVRAIFDKANISATATNYPPKRTATYILDGTLDVDVINPDWLPTESLKNRFVFSDNLLEIKEYYITRKGEPAGFHKELGSQSTKRDVGMVRGYFYHNQENYNRINFPSEKALIEALDKKRVDIIICGDLPALYWSEPQAIQLDMVKLHSKGFLQLRMRKELAPIMAQVNEAIKALHQDGSIEKIVNKYLH